MKQEINNNAMWAAFRKELTLQGELQVVAAIDNALNNLGFTIEETSTIIPILLKQGKNNMGISEATKQELEDNLNKALEKETPESLNEFLKKQGEQKHKVEPIRYGLKTEFQKQVSYLIASVLSEEYDYTIGYVQHVSQALLEYAKNELKLVGCTEKDEPKSAWSKEYENNILFLTSIIEECFKDKEKITLDGDTVCANFTKENVIERLKSLKPHNGYNPYKEVVESIAEMCKHYDKASHSNLRDFYDNVKVKCKDAKEYDSLYPNSTWKPSKKQLDGIECAIKTLRHQLNVGDKRLNSLYNDLKKLREE